MNVPLRLCQDCHQDRHFAGHSSVEGDSDPATHIFHSRLPSPWSKGKNACGGDMITAIVR